MDSERPKTFLVVLPLEPHPEGVGSQKRAAAHVSALLDGARVHLVVLDSDTTSAKAGDPSLYARCASFHVLKYTRRPRQAIAKTIPFSFLAEIFDPLSRRRLPSTGQMQAVFSKLRAEKFDATLCFKVLGATLFDFACSVVPLHGGRKVVDFDDIESLLLEAEGKDRHGRGLEQAAIDNLVRIRQRWAEDRYLATYDAVWVCSETDQRHLLARAPKAEIHAIPNSVKLVRPSTREATGVVNILFVGKMSYQPNHDGILWFCKEVLPIVRASTSQTLRLFIVGFEPRAEVQALAVADEVVVTGGVDSVDSFYLDCDVAIAPINTGGGTRIKILEAMSHQRPVVATGKGAEGLDVRSEENILLGDTPQDFADACLRLIENPELRNQIGRAGRRLIEQRYSDVVVAAAVRQFM